jgi:hypothetical protein
VYLLYLDESGSVDNIDEKHFVLAGVSVFERKTHWLEQKLNTVAARFDQQDPNSVELHGSPMRSGKNSWRRHTKADREQALIDALRLGVKEEFDQGVRLFGVVVKKDALSQGDPVEYAFEQLANRFDLFLRRLYLKKQDPQRGIILFDKSSTESRIQTLAREFKVSGHNWGQTKNYAEVPVFLDSRASRLIQLADLVAFSMFRHFEHGDPKYYDVIKDCFDTDGGVHHGFHAKLR